MERDEENRIAHTDIGLPLDLLDTRRSLRLDSNHASHYGLTVDEVANLALEHRLEHKEVLDRVIAEIKAEKKKMRQK